MYDRRSPCRTTSSTARTRSGRPSGRSRSGSPTASSCDGLSAPPAFLFSRRPRRSGARSSSSSASRSTWSPRGTTSATTEGSARSSLSRRTRRKARSVAADAGERPVLGVDTAVVLGDSVLGKPEARRRDRHGHPPCRRDPCRLGAPLPPRPAGRSSTTPRRASRSAS